MTRYVYAAWEEDRATESFSPSAMLDALSDDLLQHGDLDRAVNAFMRRGAPSTEAGRTLPGLSEFLHYLEQQKRDMLQHYAADAFRLSETQMCQFQQQVEACTARALQSPEPPEDLPPHSAEQYAALAPALRTLSAHVQQQLEARQRQGTPRPPDGPWQATDVFQDIQQALADTGGATESQEALQQQTLDALGALELYLEHVQQLEKAWQAFPFVGAQPISLAEATRLIQAFKELEALKQRLRWGAGSVLDVNGTVFERLLGPEKSQQLQQLQQCEEALAQAGLIRRTPAGLRLTARGIRQLGAKVLAEVFQSMQPGWRGQHTARRQGTSGALTGETRPYTFGDAFEVHLGRTLMQTLLRQPQVPLHMQPDDFAIHTRERLTHSATVIMLDMSHSMELFGRNRFTAAKKMALALAQLIAAHFSHDTLHVVGFGDTARELPVHELPYVTVGQEHTNTQEGLRLARTLLARQRAAQKHIVLITDGRPTAVRLHGKLQLHTWDLHPVILEETYKEAKRCRAQDITLNTFMLADEAPLVQFVKRLTAVSRGRAFYTTPERLGSYIIEDYVRRT